MLLLYDNYVPGSQDAHRQADGAGGLISHLDRARPGDDGARRGDYPVTPNEFGTPERMPSTAVP
jgi:hypothetical protein